jgi:hypothetical protein
MRRLPITRPSPAMIVAIIALIVALGGTAYAAKKIGSKQLKKNAVTTKKIKNGAVTAPKLANGVISQAAKTGVLARSTTTGCNPATTAFTDCGTVTLNLPDSGRVLLLGDAGYDGSNSNSYSGACRLTADGTVVGPSITYGQAAMAVTGSGTPVVGGAGFNSNGQSGSGLNGVTTTLSAGKHTFSLQCNQNGGNIQFEETGISAVALGTS